MIPAKSKVTTSNNTRTGTTPLIRVMYKIRALIPPYMSDSAVKNNPGILVLIASGSSVSVLGNNAPRERPRVTMKITVVINKLIESSAYVKARLRIVTLTYPITLPMNTKYKV